jgi:hypothetical protein
MFLGYVCCASKRHESDQRLKERMLGYAKLKAKCACQIESCPNSLLPYCAHEVLLGTLKKVETKSATMTTILVFALSAFVAIAFQDGSYSCYGSVIVIVASLLILPLFFAFSGIRQLDSINIANTPAEDLPQRLQSDLLRDLRKKERGFRFSRISLLYTILFLVLILVLEGASDLTQLGSSCSQRPG